MPRGWSEALDREGLIFVTAARSGNDQPIFDRRAPLALAAAANAMARYPVDPARVYVAGFSGGSRVALRLALGYPDIFRGAVLIAGADALGAPPVPPPPRDLFERFRSGTRLVYLTGEDDAANLPDDVASEASMRAFCVAGVTSIEVAHMAHQIAAETDFDRALRLLDAAPAADTARLAACRAKLDTELAAKLADAATLVGKGDKAARARLADIDRRFGGLAAPRIEELWRQATSP
jgi:pimeloyl-ACP methyl ester carboxylesterase